MRTSDINSVGDPEQDSIATWKTQEGKNVALIQPEIPWYIHKQKNTQAYIDKSDHNTYHDYANFDSKFVLDRSRPDTNYSYSYTQQHDKPCQCLECKKQNNFEQIDSTIEQFDSSEKFSLNAFIFTLFFIVIALIIIRKLT